MKTFYYFQLMVDIGVGLIITGLSIAAGFNFWIPMTLFGAYLVINYAKHTYDFMEMLKGSSGK
jgi:hypothetical protein